MNSWPHSSSSKPLLPRGVRRALDAMHANVERDWSVTELAGVAGVSSRTLQRQFRIFLGKAPRAALRDIRFDSARRELLRGLPDAKVTDVALRNGLAHCGRFSVEYRRRYGETPSQTLKRQAVFIGALTSMPSLLVSRGDRPTIALARIDASPENSDLARSIADELATALTRAGVSVTNQPGSARYQLTGMIRGSDRQTRLTFRLIDAETGRHLSAHRCDGALGGDANHVRLVARRRNNVGRFAVELLVEDRRVPEIVARAQSYPLHVGRDRYVADGAQKAIDVVAGGGFFGGCRHPGLL